MLSVSIQFILSACVVSFAAYKLCQYADVIATESRLGHVLIGGFLLAGATSLPELITTMSAAGLVGAPDMAAGTIFGSNTINLAILVILDLMLGKRSIFRRITGESYIPAIVSIILCLVALGGISLRSHMQIAGVGIDTLIILVIYMVGAWLIFRTTPSDKTSEDDSGISWVALRKAVTNFICMAAIVVAAALWLTRTGKIIATNTALGETFVGSIFLAITTSMPEIVASVTAARMGLFNMAVANVFGSNMMNVAILFFADVAYRSSTPLLSSVSTEHIFTCILVIALSLTALLGIVHRSRRKLLGLSWEAWAIAIMYVVGTYFLFVSRLFTGAL